MEIWELVNEAGEGSGVLYERASGAEFPGGLYFRVVEVWVVAGDRLLVTQRHPDKWCGLMWEVSGGGVLLGERVEESAVRELREETGIEVCENELISLGRTLHGAAMVYSYAVRLTEPPNVTPQPTEVVDYRFVTLSEARDMEGLTPGTRDRFEKFYNRLSELMSE